MEIKYGVKNFKDEKIVFEIEPNLSVPTGDILSLVFLLVLFISGIFLIN